MNTGGGNLALHYSDLHSQKNVSSAEMAIDSVCGDRVLHYSDLNSPSNVSSAEMPKDNGRGHVALRYSHLYSHESDHSAEIQMDSGGGNMCDTNEGDTFLDPMAEYTESNSESESSSREDSICDTQKQMIQSNQDQPEDLSLV